MPELKLEPETTPREPVPKIAWMWPRLRIARSGPGQRLPCQDRNHKPSDRGRDLRQPGWGQNWGFPGQGQVLWSTNWWQDSWPGTTRLGQNSKLPRHGRDHGLLGQCQNRRLSNNGRILSHPEGSMTLDRPDYLDKTIKWHQYWGDDNQNEDGKGFFTEINRRPKKIN